MTVLALASFLSLCFVLALVKIFHKLWWAPNRLQRLMRSQGIRGPPYRFIHGTTKEIIRLQEEAMSKRLSGLSHDVYPKIQPHVHRWTSLYCNSNSCHHFANLEIVLQCLAEPSQNKGVEFIFPLEEVSYDLIFIFVATCKNVTINRVAQSEFSGSFFFREV